MDRMATSKNRLTRGLSAWAACLFLLVSMFLAACGGGGGAGASAADNAGSGSDVLRPEDVRPVLSSLPYKFKLRPVQPPGHDDAAFRGRALGPDHTVVEFTVGVGAEAFAVPLPGIGTVHAISNGAAGFAFNDYVSGGGHFSRPGQWKEALQMVFEIEERLCRRATGKPCQE